MKTITINGQQHTVSTALERVILTVADHGPQAISDFEEGRGRYRRNPVGSAHNLTRETAGALVINWADYDSKKIPAAVMRARPRVQKWVMATSTRRINLVAKKLRELDASRRALTPLPYMANEPSFSISERATERAVWGE